MTSGSSGQGFFWFFLFNVLSSSFTLDVMINAPTSYVRPLDGLIAHDANAISHLLDFLDKTCKIHIPVLDNIGRCGMLG
jgi:hypothetical protein